MNNETEKTEKNERSLRELCSDETVRELADKETTLRILVDVAKREENYAIGNLNSGNYVTARIFFTR